jgi:integrase
MGDQIHAFLSYLRLGGASPRTVDQYERDLARGAILFHNKRLEDLTDADMLHIVGQFTPQQRRVRTAAWRSFAKWGLGQRIITVNPCDALPPMRKPPQKVIDVFSVDETVSLLDLPTIDAAPMALLLEAGLRKSEARHLKMRDCLPESGYVTVRAGKGSKDRSIPMTATLRAKMADLLLSGVDPEDYVCYSVHGNSAWAHGDQGRRVTRTIVRSSPIGEATFARWWRRCLDDAGVRYRNPHTARHTFATHWRRLGLDVDDLQMLLGHSSIQTTSDMYVHTRISDVEARMRAIETPSDLSCIVSGMPEAGS